MAYLRTERGTLEAEQAEVLGNISHIIPNVLYPAVNDQMGGGTGGLIASTIGPNSSTVTSSKYGTVQSDGKMYYYTDIRGSKPIKDPRIGAYFGCQRYMITSLQLRPDETALATGQGGTASWAYDQRVYSTDGRDFFRAVAAGNAGAVTNDSKGLTHQMVDYGFIEITGYFNQANLIMYTYGYTRTMTITLDGESAYGGYNPNSTRDTPLRGRHVHSGHLTHIPLDSTNSNLAATPTLGIHTLKFYANSGQGAHYPTGIELIAQDLTSTATKSQIQIPNQNVVTFGKKLAISAAAHHYNPFATKGDDSASTIPNNTTGDSVATGWAGSTSAYWEPTLDTATSLGLNAWQHSVTFDDSGDTDHTITVGGGVHHSGEENQIGSMGMSFDGSGDYLSTPQSTDWQFGTGDFTVEFWFNWNSYRSSECTICYGSGNGVEGWKLLLNTSTATWYGGSSGGAFSSSAHGMVINRWYHIAIARVSGTVTMYRDGTAIGSAGSSGDMPATSSYGVWIGTTGGGASGTQQYNGYLDEIRISKGLARYTGAFTPSTTAFTSDSNTQLLIHSGDATTAYYRPINGGRIVKWVDSSGNIKTSVNMMPPSARASGSHTGDARPTGATNWSTQYQPIFSQGPMNNSQAEVAKTFHWREFGNGAANYNTSFLDSSMLAAAAADIAYVMDDGLTSLTGDNVQATGEGGGGQYSEDILKAYDNSHVGTYISFIGTGLSIDCGLAAIGKVHVVQNLPYGSHYFKIQRTSNSLGTGKIDGVTIQATHANFDRATIGPNITIHQPKRPPIPEDAVVLADYMLMADHVVRTADGPHKVSKGVRLLSGTRDVFYNGSGNFVLHRDPLEPMGFTCYRDTESTVNSRIPAFSTNVIKLTYDAPGRYQAWYTNDTGHASAITTTKSSDSGYSSYYYPTSATTLGMNIHEQYGAKLGGGGNALQTSGFEIVSPIHTSSHYQAFETPYTHDLIGGDRNMEQTNLVVTPDGKTWDEMTRDTSYLGDVVFTAFENSTNITATGSILNLFTDHRGSATVNNRFNGITKDSIAIANDKINILKDGLYVVDFYISINADNAQGYLMVNTTNYGISTSFYWNLHDDSVSQTFRFPPLFLKRGDYLYMSKPAGTLVSGNDTGAKITITKQKETYHRHLGTIKGAREGKWKAKM